VPAFGKRLRPVAETRLAMQPATLTEQLSALAQVMLIDIALAGDNAVVVGMAAAGLEARQKRLAILVGIGGATALRMALGVIALKLLAIIGLLLAGGILLLWVCWKMYRELRRQQTPGPRGDGRKTLGQAMAQIMLADLSMSLDNVLAVAGAANGHIWVLLLGLLLAVVLMGFAANLLAHVLERQRWIAWVGLLIVLYVALKMIWQGWMEVAGAIVH
jgi:YjbE family integral membrane protein